MTTLVVRPLAPLDMPALRHLLAVDTRVDSPPWDEHNGPAMGAHAMLSLPLLNRSHHMFVALLDGDLCAAVTTRRQAPRYRRDVLSLAASAILLNGPWADCKAVWTALLEYAIRAAGEAGAKRLFASVEEDSLIYEGLRCASFEPYSRFRVVRLSMRSERVSEPEGLRQQEESDVWSIHQLYHHATPMGVQHAEALTSAAWERPSVSPLRRLTARTPAPLTFVVDTLDGIAAHCSIELHGEGAVARLLIADELRHRAYDIVVSSAWLAGCRRGSTLRVLIPAYRGELSRQFEVHGGVVESERVALIRHTTATAQVRSRAVTPLVEVAERVPRRVPTYLQEMQGTSLDSSPAA